MSVAIDRFSTCDLPPEHRYEAWRARNWPREEPVYRTVPTAPFNVLMESALLGQLVFVRTEITAMTWERRAEDIRTSDFHPIIVNMMVDGLAQGDMDGRPFHEPSGSYHFHDLGRPSLHASTASLTYSLIIPRQVALQQLAPIGQLHGLVVDGAMAKTVLDLAEHAWSMLPELTSGLARHFENAFLALLAAGFHSTMPDAPSYSSAEDQLRARAVEAIDMRLGLEKATPTTIAASVGVGVDRLAAAFRADGGLAAYILSRRLIEARTALIGQTPPEPIGSIAHRLGFSDAAHLSRTFRQRFGVSPRDYRRMGYDMG